MRLTPESRVAQTFSPSFDGVLMEVFPPLFTGAAVVFGARTQTLPGPALIDWLTDEHISHLSMVPSALGMVPYAELPDLQVITVAGEACPPETARRWARGRRLLNGYGPTECAVCVSVTEYWEEGAKLVIRALRGQHLYVLDSLLNEVPIGATGELFCGGDCVGHGYLGLAGRTSTVFVADPVSGRPGARMYRTGDIVRRLDNGVIEFVGRIDRQVKIRGNRIELDAVRAALTAIPGVRQAEVLAKADHEGRKELVAYVAGSCSRSGIMNALRGSVPAAMVPSTFSLSRLR